MYNSACMEAFRLPEGEDRNPAPFVDSGKFDSGHRCWSRYFYPRQAGQRLLILSGMLGNVVHEPPPKSETLPLQEVELAAFFSVWEVSEVCDHRDLAASFNFSDRVVRSAELAVGLREEKLRPAAEGGIEGRGRPLALP